MSGRFIRFGVVAEATTSGGKRIGGTPLKAGKNEIMFKEWNASNGVYIYKVWLNGILNNTSRLVILDK
jgi:hypothetical protein